MLFLKWEVTQVNLVPEKFYVMKWGVGSLHSFFSSFFSRHLIADTIIFRMTLFLTTCWNNNIRVNLLILFRMALSSTVKKSKTKSVAVPQGVHDGKTGLINSYKDGFWAYLSSVLEKYLECIYCEVIAMQSIPSMWSCVWLDFMYFNVHHFLWRVHFEEWDCGIADFITRIDSERRGSESTGNSDFRFE